MKTESTCPYCKGSGRECEGRGEPVFRCPDCNGTGKLWHCSECNELSESCNCAADDEEPEDGPEQPTPVLIRKFHAVYCSQCSRDFGTGDHGFSSCKSHKGFVPVPER